MREVGIGIAGFGTVGGGVLSILEKKLDAALFGLPGRTTIVGRRIERPSMNPLRE